MKGCNQLQALPIPVKKWYSHRREPEVRGFSRGEFKGFTFASFTFFLWTLFPKPVQLAVSIIEAFSIEVPLFLGSWHAHGWVRSTFLSARPGWWVPMAADFKEMQGEEFMAYKLFPRDTTHAYQIFLAIGRSMEWIPHRMEASPSNWRTMSQWLQHHTNPYKFYLVADGRLLRPMLTVSWDILCCEKALAS